MENKEFESFLRQQRGQQNADLMLICLVSSMEVLKEKFDFDQEKLNKFAEEYTPALKKYIKEK